jgi:hypothetical protein
MKILDFAKFFQIKRFNERPNRNLTQIQSAYVSMISILIPDFIEYLRNNIYNDKK